MNVGSLQEASDIANFQQEAACINAVPARWIEQGFRLLVLRNFHKDNEPPAFAWIDQHLLRTPERLGRHGLFFGSAFRPDVMTWLSEQLGRPSVHDNGKPYRNPRWPIVSWHGEDRLWPDGACTTEWFVDVVFKDEESWGAFRQRWLERLLGKDI
jgi:hypothetical protein